MSVICPVLLSHRITFFFLGIASLIGWNAILTAMTFFSMYYPKELYGDVTFLFPIPLFFANFIWGLVTPKISQHFSLQYRISFCLAAVAFFMICLPIITVYLSNPTGFTLCLITIFIIGSFNSIASNSIVGLVAQVHPSLAGSPFLSIPFFLHLFI